MAFQTCFGVISPPAVLSTDWVFLASDHLLVSLGRESWPEMWCEYTWLFSSTVAGVLEVLWIQVEQGGILQAWQTFPGHFPGFFTYLNQQRDSAPEPQDSSPLAKWNLALSALGLPLRYLFCSGVWCVMGRGAY